MIYLILFCVLVLVFVFAVQVLKTACIKNHYTKKIRFDFKGVQKSLLSKFFWSVIGAFAIIYALSLLLPLVWMFLTSVKGDIDFERNNFGLPKKWEWSNYVTVFNNFKIRQGLRTYGVGEMLFNSIFYSCGNPLVSLFWMYSMAYVMARFKWFGNKFLYSLGVVLMMVDIVGDAASRMIIYQSIGLYDNMYLMTILPTGTYFSGMYFMIIYGACKAISQTYSEAAYIDGANEYLVMFKIIFPMLLPTLCTLYVLTFLSLWNNYSTFLVWFPSTPNIAFGLYLFQNNNAGSAGLSTPQIIAGMVMVMIPSCILYACTQGVMKSNFVVGGLKG